MAGCLMIYFFARWTTFCVVLVLVAGYSVAQPFNVTVDDLGPLPVVGGIDYIGDWTQSGLGFDRDDFKNSLGFENTVNKTWHKTTRPKGSSSRATATLQFTGTAVYVQCVLNKDSTGGRANSEMYFKIDDEPEMPFIQPALLTNFGLITTVFSKEGLRPGNHTIVIANGPQDGNQISFDNIVIFLDAIIYTTGDEPDPSVKSPASDTGTTATSSLSVEPTSAPSELNQPKPSSALSSEQIGIIVGGVCGGLVGLLATFLLFWLWRRRAQDSNYYPTAFDPRRFVRWPGSRPKAPSAQYSSDMEAMRPSQPSVNSLYMYPSPSYGQTSSAYGNDQKY